MAGGRDPELEERIRATIYGNCIGDTIGLLTEFMVKKEAKTYYGNSLKSGGLEFEQKVMDLHRNRWAIGDWTDDSDQMILIMDSLLACQGQANEVDYGRRLKFWTRHGFPELGDIAGMGIGATTCHVLRHKLYDTQPSKAAADVWEKSGQFVAPNGGVMRTSVTGLYQFNDMEKVIENTKVFCKVTHVDPRCIASCVAVASAIAFMLQKSDKHFKNGKYDANAISRDSYELAVKCFEGDYKHHIKEFKQHMFAKDLSDLKLDENKKIGYTLKTLGAGFWAFRQKDFRDALQKIVMEAGDADTNAAVAGALLGCKVGIQGLPQSWLNGLKHKKWLDSRIKRFLQLIHDEPIDPPSPADRPAEDPRISNFTAEQMLASGSQISRSSASEPGRVNYTDVDGQKVSQVVNSQSDNTAALPRENPEGEECKRETASTNFSAPPTGQCYGNVVLRKKNRGGKYQEAEAIPGGSGAFVDNLPPRRPYSLVEGWLLEEIPFIDE